MSSVVLDASALLAFLHREPGAELVERNLSGAALSAVNYSEVLKKAVERGGTLIAAKAVIRGLQLEIVPFTESQASDAASLWVGTRALGLSLADRCCLTLAQSLNRTVLTADRRWAEVGTRIRVTLIR